MAEAGFTHGRPPHWHADGTSAHGHHATGESLLAPVNDATAPFNPSDVVDGQQSDCNHRFSYAYTRDNGYARTDLHEDVFFCQRCLAPAIRPSLRR